MATKSQLSHFWVLEQQSVRVVMVLKSFESVVASVAGCAMQLIPIPEMGK
jgi:hypothetical protein